ncbi:MAG TPA: hypothetical protein VND70_08960 [Acidimicrobiales bacterium]|nr:hypothetical protein [Acidimicrobiales bacterium]
MVDVGSEATGRPRPYPSRGRPNWWVILAVSLALMALLVATSAGSRGSGPQRLRAQSDVTSRGTTPGTTEAPLASALRSLGATGTGTPLTTVPPTRAGTGSTAAMSAPPVSTTTTTVAAAASGPLAPADRTTNQGYLQPPTNASNTYAFTGNGSVQVSVTWGNDTYLSLDVSCPNVSQSVGGSSAMAVTLSDAQGACQATVSEPATESTTLTYNIAIGPPGGT